MFANSSQTIHYHPYFASIHLTLVLLNPKFYPLVINDSNKLYFDAFYHWPIADFSNWLICTVLPQLMQKKVRQNFWKGQLVKYLAQNFGTSQKIFPGKSEKLCMYRLICSHFPKKNLTTTLIFCAMLIFFVTS